MIRITQFVHGKGTVSEAIKHRKKVPGEMPRNLLAFSEKRRPIIFWNLTNRCNLACSHCYINAHPGAKRDDELSTAEMKAVIDDLAAMGTPLILLSGGEPLVRNDFWEIAEYIQGKGMKSALSTNGTLIDPAVALRLRNSGVEYVGVSLDGATPETHDRIRNRTGSFADSLRALRACKAIGLPCGVRITVTRDNFRELGDLIDLAVDVGASRFCVYWLVPTGRGQDGHASRQLSHEEVQEVIDLLFQKAHEIDPTKLEILTVDSPQDSVYFLQRMRREDRENAYTVEQLLSFMGSGCSAGDRVANIDPSGDVYPCQFAQESSLRIGNVREEKFSTLWNDAENEVLAAFRERPIRLEGACGACAERKLCGGGCRVRAWARDHSLASEDPFCSVRTPEPVTDNSGIRGEV
jgi:radical SAM protein with 4Fe4S-binding SPASM domain